MGEWVRSKDRIGASFRVVHLSLDVSYTHPGRYDGDAKSRTCQDVEWGCCGGLVGWFLE